jgi:2-octaprenylphenol hydroxylase
VKTIDIVIAGAGPVGLATAALLASGPARDRCRITILDAAAPRRWRAEVTDLRVYALSHASAQILTSAGAWSAIAAKRVTPYSAMQIWEGATFESAGRLSFESRDIGEPDLGHIVEDALICGALSDVLQRTPGVEVKTGTKLTSIEFAEQRVFVGTDTAAGTLSAHLLIGADGGRSPVREAAGLPGIARDYRQQAIVAHVVPQRPHAHTAWQRFLPGGPLALLPLSDGRCSIVWSLPAEQAAAYAATTRREFDELLTRASGRVLGDLHRDTDTVALPLHARHALRYCRARLALAGDAAHTVHPLAGQGVNLGFADAAAIAHCVADAVTAGQDPGDLRVLRRYERARSAQNLLMLGALDGLDRLFRAPRVLAPLRAAGLSLVDRLPLLKRDLIRHASGGAVMSR